MLTQAIREYAETPDRFAPVPRGSSITRHDDGRICFIQGADWGSVSAPHVAAERSRRWSTRCAGSPGSATSLVDRAVGAAVRLVERLRVLGFVDPTDQVGTLRAVALTDEPAVTSRDIEVQRVKTFREFAAARRLQWDVFDPILENLGFEDVCTIRGSKTQVADQSSGRISRPRRGGRTPRPSWGRTACPRTRAAGAPLLVRSGRDTGGR